jgi:hypothetical protein
MRIPVIRGLIDRRILVNYRVEPAVLARVVPAPFRPRLVNGMGMAGVCLIRLKHIRPRWAPSIFGISSENAAHRIAVEWDQGGQRRTGVYIPRRDTSSRLNTLVGGKFFPGVHHHATFQVEERCTPAHIAAGDYYRVVLDSDDGGTHLAVEARVSSEFPSTSVFVSLEEASAFFERGALGYSATSRPGEYDGLELRSFIWQVQALAVTCVESSFFEDREAFPGGSVIFDCALLMRGIEHEWLGRDSLYALGTQTCMNERGPRTTPASAT